MATGIPYATETWDVLTGCPPDEHNLVCRDHCWAAALARRWPATHAGYRPVVCSLPTEDQAYVSCRMCGRECAQQEAIPFSETVFHPDRLDQPLHWKEPRVVLVASRGDVFHDQVPDEFIEQVFLTVQAGRDGEGSDTVVYWAPSLGEEIGTALALEHGRVAQIASHEARQRPAATEPARANERAQEGRPEGETG